MPQRRRNSPDVVAATGGGQPPSTMAKQQSQRMVTQPFPSSPSTASAKASGPPSGLSNFLARGVKLFGRSTSIAKSSQSSPHVDASQSHQRSQQDRIRQRNVSGPTLPRAPPPPSQNGSRLVFPASRSVLDLSSSSAVTTDNSPSGLHSDANGDLRRISKLSWAHSADDLGTLHSLHSSLDTKPSSTSSGPRPSSSDRSTPTIETPTTADEFRKLPLNIRIEAYRSGMTPVPSPIQTSHPPIISKTRGGTPSGSSPIHPRFSHEMLQTSFPPVPSNTSHNRSLSQNKLAANSTGATPSALVEPPRPLQRQNPVLEGAERTDRTKSVNNFAFPFSFGKPIANGGLAEPHAEPKKRISQIIQYSGFLNRNTGTGVPRDLSRDWKAYKAEIKGSKLYLYKPPHDRAPAVKGLFVTDASLVDEPFASGGERALTESPTESRKLHPFWGPGPHRDTLRDDKGLVVGGTAEALVYEMVFGPLFTNEQKQFDEDAWKEFSRPILFCLPALTGRDAFENGFVNSADHYIRYLNDQKALRDGRRRVEWLLSQYAHYQRPEPLSPILEVFLSTFSFTITQLATPTLHKTPVQSPIAEHQTPHRAARNGAPLFDQTSQSPNANAGMATFVENLNQRGLSRATFTHFDSLVIAKSLDMYFKSELVAACNLFSSGILERSLDDVHHPWAAFFGTEARPHWLTLLIVKQIVGPSNNCLAGTRNSESGGSNYNASKTHLRSQSVMRWIHVGEHFRQLGNEVAWRAIMEGICAKPVARLEKAWRRVEIVERQVVEGWIRDGKVSTGRMKENVPWLAEKAVLLIQALGNVQHHRDGKAELDLQGMKIVMNSVQNVLQGWDGYTDESGGAGTGEVASALLLYWKHFAEIVRTTNMIPAGGVDYYLTQSLNAEPAQRSLYSVHHHKPRSQHYTAHAIAPFIFPESLPSISLLDRRAILRVRKESLDKPQRLDEGRMKRVAQLKLLSAEHSLLGLGGTRVDSDLEGETVFRLFGGEIIVKVAKEPQDSRPNSTLDNGPTLTRKPSKALGIRVTPQAASTLERKPSAARRQSLPLLTTSRLASAEPSVNPSPNDSSFPVVIIAGTVERLVDVLVRGLDYVTAATADDNGEMTLRARKSRSMRLDQTEFSKTWWRTYRSFVTPDIFVMMLLRLFDTTLPSAAPSNHDHTDDANLRLSILTVLSDWITQGGGAQDLLDNADICRELRHFLHNDEKHAVPEGISKESPDRPAWEEVQDLRKSSVMLFERLIRRPSLSALIVHEPGPSERVYGPHPPDIDDVDVEDLIGCLDAIGATAFRYVQPEDLLAVADFMEMQSADRTGWLTIPEQLHSQEEVEIQTIYSYLQLVDTSPLISKHVRGPVYKLFPPSVRATIRAHIACRHWVISRIAAQGIGRRTRQSRIELLLQAIEISRSRSQGVLVDRMEESPVVRSFVETVLTSALLSPQSRLFTRVWQDVAVNRGASIDSFETFISTPLASVTGKKPTVDFGWLLERMIEIISLPDTLQDEGDGVGLVNFEKRRHLCNFVYTVPTLVPGRSLKQKAQLDKQDADRMTAMLEDSRWILDHSRTVKEEAHKENTSSTSAGQGRRLSRPFSRTITAQQEKNKRDRQFRDHFSREKKLEQQRLEKQSITYEKTMALAKGGPISISKTPKHAKKASNAFFRVVRPLSTAFPFSYNTGAAAPSRQWSLPELDFTPTNKPSLSINLAAARTKAVTTRARSYVFTVDTEDNGRFYFQAINRTEMERWLKTIENTSTTTAEKRRTYVGPAPPLELLTRARNLGRHPTAVFAVDLAYLIEREHGTDPPPGAVPRILVDCLQQVEQRGFTEIGIYRISGSKLTVDSLKFDYNTGHAIDLNEQDIHNVCSLVKSWLREIPGGLFPGKAFWQVIQALQSVEGRLPDAMAECIGMVQTIIDDLPTANYNVLRCICDHLVQASTHEDITNMAEGNFAICFGQTILAPPDDQAAIMATGYANRFVNTLLNNYHAIFERDQENEVEGDADADADVDVDEDEEGGETAPDTHYLEGLEEEEDEDRVSSAGHVPAGTTTSADSYGLAL